MMFGAHDQQSLKYRTADLHYFFGGVERTARTTGSARDQESKPRNKTSLQDHKI